MHLATRGNNKTKYCAHLHHTLDTYTKSTPFTYGDSIIEVSLLVKTRKLDLIIDVQCVLFHKTVVSVLLYSSELWIFSSINMLVSFMETI